MMVECIVRLYGFETILWRKIKLDPLFSPQMPNDVFMNYFMLFLLKIRYIIYMRMCIESCL